jgi:hypothetical protein
MAAPQEPLGWKIVCRRGGFHQARRYSLSPGAVAGERHVYARSAFPNDRLGIEQARTIRSGSNRLAL